MRKAIKYNHGTSVMAIEGRARGVTNPICNPIWIMRGRVGTLELCHEEKYVALFIHLLL